ncbi:septum formation family protein [Actinacidiphila alni]|uniref:septum formation family protein n=1 Tax=Actinacidiphila alni TaxID=380248 RepID=UPI0033CD2799
MSTDTQPQPESGQDPVQAPVPTPEQLNDRAVRALKRSWIPGVGIVAGRRALKEIKWSGEGGRTQARWAVGVNTVVTGAVVAGLFVGWSGGSSHRTVSDLRARQCFNITGRKILTPGMGENPEVATVDCSQSHVGEVVGFWDADSAWDDYPGEAALRSRADAECARELVAYAPDTWRLADTVTTNFYGPTESGWSNGEHRVVCYAGTGATSGPTASVRQDVAALTPDQKAYLDAENIYNIAEIQQPDAENATQDFPGWKKYAADMATAELKVRGALRAHHWPAATVRYTDRMASDAERAAEQWRKAADASNGDDTDRLVKAAEAIDAATPAADLRALLELATGDPDTDTARA